MELSIDMLSIGNADAIVIWLKEGQDSLVALIDGGNPKDGAKVIQHLETHIFPYTQQKAPDLVISTHPDKDHIGGLIEIIKHYGSNISQVWVHDPRNHVDYNYFDSMNATIRRRTFNGYNIVLESLNHLHECIDLVDSFGIPRVEPFYPLQVGPIRILGPSEEFYTALLPSFRNLENYLIEEGNLEYLTSRNEYNNSHLSPILREIFEEQSPCPTVDESNDSSSENESSVVIEITVNGLRHLFPADAGVKALQDINSRTPLNDIHWLAVPHHGSRRNLTSDLIRFMNPKIGFISAVGDRKHPRRALINCLKKHGCILYSTHKSDSLWHHIGNFPSRSFYGPIEPL